MFEINEDKTINITRGDIGAFTVDALNEAGEKYLFQKGDVVRIKVTEKKACENVMFQKDFVVEEETEQVEILLTEEETKIGEVISKPTDYWYEVELNPLTNPQTIISYDEDGAKILRLYPEGNDIEPVEPTPEDIPVVDEELDLTSERPVQNHVIARAILNLQEEIARIDTDVNITSEDLEPLQGAIEANKTNIAKNTGNIEDLTNNVEELNAHTANTSNPHNVTAEQTHFDKNISGMNADNVQGAMDEVVRTIGYTASKNYLPNNNSTHTLGGVTFTVNDDKSITANGTGTLNPWAYFLFVGNYNNGVMEEIKGLEDGVEYIFSCCPQGADGNTYQGHLCINGVSTVLRDNGDGVKFTHQKGNKYAVSVAVKQNYTASNLKFYPMIRKATEDDTYEPYVADVQSRLLSIKQKTMTVTTDANGNALLGLPISTHVINITSNSFLTSDMVGFIPCVANSSWYVRLVKNYGSYAPKGSVTATITVTYLE